MPEDTINPDTSPATQKTTLLGHIATFVRDVTALDVVTLTGNLKLVDPGTVYDSTKRDFDWNEFFKKVTEGMKPSQTNELEIVAYTHADLDLDTAMFVKRTLSDTDKALLAAHNTAVESAQKSRFEAVRIVGGLMNLKF